MVEVFFKSPSHRDTETLRHRVTEILSCGDFEFFLVLSSAVPEPVEGKARRFDKLSDRSAKSLKPTAIVQSS